MLNANIYRWRNPVISMYVTSRAAEPELEPEVNLAAPAPNPF